MWEAQLDDKCSSSEEAFDFLVRFCRRNELCDQAFAALEAALMVPTHNTHRVPVSLPTPYHLAHELSHSRLDKFGYLEEACRLLTFYMTISLHGLTPILCSLFFNDSVSCNLSSQWLEPGIRALEPLSRHAAAIAGALHRPNLAGWWTGAVLSGLYKHILRIAKGGVPPIQFVSSWWTRSPQSFLCTTQTEPIQRGTWIDRSKEALLLFLFEPIWDNEGPISPWMPPGTVQYTDTMIEVRVHSTCGSPHYLEYTHWIWLGPDGPVIDTGCSSEVDMEDGHCVINTAAGGRDPTLAGFLEYDEASKASTSATFRWLEREGRALGDKDMGHALFDWIGLDDNSEDENDAIITASSVSSAAKDVESWLSNVKASSEI